MKVSPHLYAIASFTLFAMMSACIKALGGQVQVPLLLLSRFSVSFTMLCLIAGSPSNVVEKMKTANLKWHVLRAGLAVTAAASIFYVMPHVPLAEINMLGQTYPFLLMMISTFVLKEPVKNAQYCSCVLGFIGVLMIVRPSGDIGLLPALLVLNAAFFNASGDLLVRWLTRTDQEVTIILWFFLLSTLFSFIWCLFYVTDLVLTFKEWEFVVCAGILGAAAQYFLTKAYKHLKAGTMAPYSYLGLALAVLFGWLVFHEIPTLWMVAGGLFIMAGVQWNYLASRVRSR